MRSILLYTAVFVAAALALAKTVRVVFVEFRLKQLVYAAFFAWLAVWMWGKRKTA